MLVGRSLQQQCGTLPGVIKHLPLLKADTNESAAMNNSPSQPSCHICPLQPPLLPLPSAICARATELNYLSRSTLPIIV
jgi:hypothetical protein